MAVMKEKDWKHGETDEHSRSGFEKTFMNSYNLLMTLNKKKSK